MAGTSRHIRVGDRGQITLPADVRRRLKLKKGDVVAVEDTLEGVLLTPGGPESNELTGLDQPRGPLFAEPTSEELVRRRAAVTRILAFRERMPSIAPLTAADLVHMARDRSAWYGDEEH